MRSLSCFLFYFHSLTLFASKIIVDILSLGSGYFATDPDLGAKIFRIRILKNLRQRYLFLLQRRGYLVILYFVDVKYFK